MAEQACTTYGYQPSEKLHEIFTKYCKTHNEGVFDAYTDEMKIVRHNHILTGLPDTYGRGRIVGDYRRVALYGVDFLIEEKQKDLRNCGDGVMVDDVIRLREEISMQIKALYEMRKWRRFTVTTFQTLQTMLVRLFSGSTSATFQLSRHRTELPCQLVVYLLSSIFTSTATSKKVH